MTRLGLVKVLIILSMVVNAQHPIIDSLQTVLEDDLTLQERVLTTYALSVAYTARVSAEEGKQVADEALLALSEEDREGIGVNLMVALVNGEFHSGNLPKALALGRKLVDEDMFSEPKAHLLRNMAHMSYAKGDLDSMDYYIGLSEIQAREWNDPKIIIGVLIDKGIAAAIRGEIMRSDTILEEALSKARETNTMDRATFLLKNLGENALVRQDYSDALKYHEEALEIVEDQGLLYEGAFTLANMARISLLIEDFERAESYFQRAAEMIKSSPRDANSVVNIYLMMSEYYLNKENWPKYEEAITNGFAVARKFKDNPKLAIFHALNANKYSSQGLKELSESSKDSALFYSADIKLVPDVYIYNSQMSEYYLEARDREGAERTIAGFGSVVDTTDDVQAAAYFKMRYRLAMLQEDYGGLSKSLKRFLIRNDSALVKMNRDKLVFAKEEFETVKKEEENEELKQANSLIYRQNDKLSLGIGLLGLLTFGILFFAYSARKARIAVDKKNLELEDLNLTKNKLFGIISHDLRSEIGGFQNLNTLYVHYLESGQRDKLEKLGRAADQSATALNKMLDNLLVWARNQIGGITLNRKDINIKNLVDEVFELHKPVAQMKNLTLKSDISEDIDINADYNGFYLIIRNLVDNAIKFSRQDGMVLVSAKKSSSGVGLSIQDQGVGISSSDLENLFDLDNKSVMPGTSGERGMGLGLYLVKEFVDQHEAVIKVESVINEGTTFYIDFPA